MREKDKAEDGLLMNLRRLLLEELSEDFPMTPAETLAKIADQYCVRLCAEFGGNCLYFPMSLPERFARRNAEILAAFRAGGSYVQLARAYKLTERRIRVLVEEARKAERQKLRPKGGSERTAGGGHVFKGGAEGASPASDERSNS